MNIMDKLNILGDAAKYDVSCSSSGGNRKSNDGIGNTCKAGICHSFISDGRCLSLLKILMTNMCIFDCKYCMNRKSNNITRTYFTPEEIANLTINFYKRNYIEGLFLSSGVIKSPDYTMEKIIEALTLLRNKYKFNGYIHAKAIPGCSEELVKKLGLLADRVSINVELPTQDGLKLLAPDKHEDKIINTMGAIKEKINKSFVPAGQTTQMIVGATKESDLNILSLTENLYKNYKLKRVYYSAYMPINKDKLLPSIGAPLVRENRLYQADWLLRFYGFNVNDLLNEGHENFNYLVDPKVDWALRNIKEFPVEINKVDYKTLLKVPGIGVLSAKKIISTRRYVTLTFENLKKMGIVLKRAKYFVTCDGKYYTNNLFFNRSFIENKLSLKEENKNKYEQLEMFNNERKNILV